MASSTRVRAQLAKYLDRIGVGMIAIGLIAATIPAVISALHPTAAGAHVNMAASRAGWVASWAAGPVAATDLPSALASFTDQTVRETVYPSVGGDALRIRLSNLYGTRPVTVGIASVGVVLDGARLVAGSSRPVTFSGKASVSIPPGAEAVSDPLGMPVRAQEELDISLYLPVPTGAATNHLDAHQATYMAAGNRAVDDRPDGFKALDDTWYFADGLDVRSVTADGTVVAFGDSITDGVGSNVGANDR